MKFEGSGPLAGGGLGEEKFGFTGAVVVAAAVGAVATGGAVKYEYTGGVAGELEANRNLEAGNFPSRGGRPHPVCPEHAQS